MHDETPKTREHLKDVPVAGWIAVAWRGSAGPDWAHIGTDVLSLSAGSNGAIAVGRLSVRRLTRAEGPYAIAEERGNDTHPKGQDLKGLGS